MIFSSILNPNVINFHNLALFICHLFIDGRFRYMDILYDSSVFDEHLPSQIESICPVQIPWQLTDINKSPSLSGTPEERTDHILQLIFFDPEQLVEEIDRFNHYLTYYRIFIFLSKAESLIIEAMTEAKKQFEISDPFSLFFDPNNGSIQIHWMNGKSEIFESILKPLNIFERIFGEHDQVPISIVLENMFMNKRNEIAFIPEHGRIFSTNFFYATLNETHIFMKCGPYGIHTWPTTHFNQTVIPKERKYYKEISMEYNTFDTEQS